jgi:hypothetical protein
MGGVEAYLVFVETLSIKFMVDPWGAFEATHPVSRGNLAVSQQEGTLLILTADPMSATLAGSETCWAAVAATQRADVDTSTQGMNAALALDHVAATIRRESTPSKPRT